MRKVGLPLRKNDQHYTYKDYRQWPEDEVDTVVQPDILVVCDPDKLRTKGVWGAPDLTVEILSPSSSRKDLREKFDLYQRSGVKEYWVIEPAGRWVQQYSMGADGQYAPEVTLIEKGVLTSTVLPDFTLEISGLWPGSTPPA